MKMLNQGKVLKGIVGLEASLRLVQPLPVSNRTGEESLPIEMRVTGQEGLNPDRDRTRADAGERTNSASEPRKYIVVVAEDKELKQAAQYLKEDLIGERGVTDIVELPDMESTIKFWLEHPFDVPLIVADMRDPVISVGSRLNYVRSLTDPELSTGVINPYGIRYEEAGNGDTTRMDTNVTEIERGSFVNTIKLELADMTGIRKRRGGVESISFDQQKREVLAANRRRKVDSLIHQHGDYIMKGLPKLPAEIVNNPENIRRMRIKDLMNRPEYFIQEMMRYIDPEDPDKQDNNLIGDIAATLEELIGLGTRRSGTVIFGEESLGGPYTLDERTLLESRGKTPLGYKPLGAFEEAKERKNATDFHLHLREANKKKANLEDDVGRLWYRAMLNPPEIKGVVPVNEHGNIKNHGAMITVFKGLGLGQIILPELNQAINEGYQLAVQLRAATLEVTMERFGFWRANPFIEVSAVADTPVYYTSKEGRFFRLASGIFNLGLKEEDFADIDRYLTAVNSRLIVDPSDLGLRMDLKWYNLGYALEKQPQPTAKDVIGAVNAGGLVGRNKVRDLLVNYDLDGIKVLVPRHHDFSHIETDPLTQFKGQEESQLYLGKSILDERMFMALNAGNNAMALDLSNQVTAMLGGHLKPFDVPELRDYEERIATPNRPVTNFYRCLEEAEQILHTRLPRVIVRLRDVESGAVKSPEAYARVELQVRTHTNNFWDYVKSANEWHAVASENLRLGTRQRRGYDLVTTLLSSLTPKEIPSEKVVQLWDGL